MLLLPILPTTDTPNIITTLTRIILTRLSSKFPFVEASRRLRQMISSHSIGAVTVITKLNSLKLTSITNLKQRYSNISSISKTPQTKHRPISLK